jgi:hypothetical protein
MHFHVLGACFNFPISFVARCPHKTGLNRDSNHSGTAASVLLESVVYVRMLDKMISRKGLNVCQAAYAKRTYKSHRRVG